MNEGKKKKMKNFKTNNRKAFSRNDHSFFSKIEITYRCFTYQ